MKILLQGRVEGELLQRLESIVGDEHTFVMLQVHARSLSKKAKMPTSSTATAARISSPTYRISNGFNPPVRVWTGTCTPRSVRVMFC